jgi:hypothetical protein
MVEIQVPTDSQWYNLFELGSLDSLSYIVSNTSNASVRLIQSTTQPEMTERGWLLNPSQTVLVHASDNPCWIRCTSTPAHVNVQPLTGTIAPFLNVDLPHDMYTGNAEGFRRIRVDSAQTSFFEGREGRMFKELSLASGATYVIKVVVAVDTVLYKVDLVLDAGAITLRTKVGGTEGGTFTALPSVFLKNNMTTRRQPYYVLRNQLFEGGTHTGGTTLDVVKVATAGATAQKTTVGSSPFDERGVSANTYYFVFTNTSNETSTGVFHCWWEERPLDAYP